MSEQAEIVIIGGGAIGCSIAYHLAKLGKRDVLLIEQYALTHGSTWHAAGLVGQLRSKRNLTRMMQDSVALYGQLEAETGQATDWKPVGSLRVASSPERWQEIKRTATTARSFGFEMHLMGVPEAQQRFPLMSTEGVVGAAFVPSDGYIDPSSLTQALAKGARAGGVRIREGVRVTDLTVRQGRIVEVATNHGNIACETLVIAAGIWARELAAKAGFSLPAGAVEHQYMVTEKFEAVDPALPTFRDPDKLIYLKPDVGALALGGWEPDTVPFGSKGMPEGFQRSLLDANFDRFEQLAVKAASRLPILNEVGVRELINGPIPVSADGEPVMGRAPGFENLFVACGFTAGIAAAGGAGKAMAAWIAEGDPGMDLWAFDIRRFGPHQSSRRFLEERCVESYGAYYKMHWPGAEPESARRLRLSPLYPMLEAMGAVYGSKAGWERPNWFARDGREPVDRPAFERPNWFDAVGEEHRAVRERVGLIDLSSFAKFEVSGRGALEAMQRITANDLNRPVGSVVYSQLCNARGGIEADLTIVRLDEECFYVITGSGFAVRDAGWICTQLPRESDIQLRDVTSAWSVIHVCGPRSRDLLEKVAEEDVGNEAFPFYSARQITIGSARVRALRLSYTGELGYELHCPSETAPRVYGLLWQAGHDLGVANIGYRCLESLRLEKRHLYWSAELTPDTNPYEAGLGFCVALDKGDFLGRDALAQVKAEGAARKLCCFTLESDVPVFGGEAILHEGKVLGVTTSGGFGYTIGKPIVLGYLPVEAAGHRDYEVEAFAETHPAIRHDRPLYDPDRRRALA